MVERSEAAGVVMAMSQERRACLGLWVLLLLGAGMEEVVEGCSCHPAHPQQLFCSAEIGKLLTPVFTRTKVKNIKAAVFNNSRKLTLSLSDCECNNQKGGYGFKMGGMALPPD